MGSAHPSRGLTLSGAAANLRLKGKSEEAVPMYRTALQVLDSSLGPESPAAVFAASSLAEVVKMNAVLSSRVVSML